MSELCEGLARAEHSNRCFLPSPPRAWMVQELIYSCLKEAIVRPLRQREKEKASPTNIQTLNHVPLSFSEPWPCLCRAALCKTSSSLWPPLGASTPKTWRSSSGGIHLEAPPSFSCLEVASSHLWQLGDHTCWGRSQASLHRPWPLRLLP